MTGASVRLDARACSQRQQMGPTAWMVLEELCLSASGADRDGWLWVPVSVRMLSEATRMGRSAVAVALHGLVTAGIVRREGARRGEGGRFGTGGYWLRPPAGISVTGATVVGPPVAGGTDMVAVTPDSRAGGRRVPRPTMAPAAGQASLFAELSLAEEDELAAAETAAGMVNDRPGAIEHDGYEVDSRGHELAPVVRPTADPRIDPTLGVGGC